LLNKKRGPLPITNNPFPTPHNPKGSGEGKGRDG